MDTNLLDLYSDYLLSTFNLATATGMSAMLDNAYSHDQITRFLGKRQYSQTDYWQTIKPFGLLYLVSSDTSLTYDLLTTIYQKRWNVEGIHKSLKQNAALERSPTKTITSQSNHIFAAMIAVTKLECLKLAHHSNHFQLKAKLYLKAVKAAFDELSSLNSTKSSFGKFLSA